MKIYKRSTGFLIHVVKNSESNRSSIFESVRFKDRLRNLTLQVFFKMKSTFTRYLKSEINQENSNICYHFIERMLYLGVRCTYLFIFFCNHVY